MAATEILFSMVVLLVIVRGEAETQSRKGRGRRGHDARMRALPPKKDFGTSRW
jgi:hypothetical protein